MKLELEIASRIRELRITKNMTQEQLAEKIGIDVSYLGRIERGKSSNIQISTLEKIVNALDVDYLTFFAFKNTENRFIEILHELSLSNNEDEILDVIEKIIKLVRK